MNPDELADLEEQREFLRRSLDDLERELAAGDIDALDAATLRADYARRLADVEQAIATGHDDLLHAAPPRNKGRLVGGIVLVAVLAVGAGVAVAQSSGSRRPGDTATGNIRESTNDHLERAARLQEQGEFLDALKAYDDALQLDPSNAEALAERGFLLMRLSIGSEEPRLLSDGRDYVEQAIEVDPGEARWLFYRAVGLRLAGQEDAAELAFDQALAADPPAQLRQTIEQFRASISD